MSRLRFMNLFLSFVFLMVLFNTCYSLDNYEKYTVDGVVNYNFNRHEIKTLARERRDAAGSESTNNTSSPAPTNATTAAVSPGNVTTANKTEASTNAPASTPSVTLTPLLSDNRTNIVKVQSMEPKVSDPIDPDEPHPFEDVKRILAEHNLSNLTIDTNGFYNTSFIGNTDYFNEFWSNITKINAPAHELLSDSYRRATTFSLKFPFPFYGHRIQNVTVATGGFLYIGEHIHNWLAATQYIAPLMGNFDTSKTNDSVVKLYDDGEKFVAFWENVNLQEDTTKRFTFSVTLFKNGDIVFAYKHIPIDIQKINDTLHPVKVGISDAFLKDQIVFPIRSKTIYEYHRVSLKNYVISNNTIIRLTALPTCLQYNNCIDCLNHDTYFNCTWCSEIQKCSSGTDRNKQDWKQRNCHKLSITNATQCPAPIVNKSEPNANAGTAYTTDTEISDKTKITIQTKSDDNTSRSGFSEKVHAASTPSDTVSPVGGVIISFLVISSVVSLIAWVYYAFKNPHTKSGQLLIKYRPSQWNWRRGEARYTAATIHM